MAGYQEKAGRSDTLATIHIKQDTRQEFGLVGCKKGNGVGDIARVGQPAQRYFIDHPLTCLVRQFLDPGGFEKPRWLIVSARGYASSGRVCFQKQYFPRRGIARRATRQGVGLSRSVYGLFEEF